jgi:hypothetical protein
LSAEGKREQLREALQTVAIRGVAVSDSLLADIRSAFLEARQNFDAAATQAIHQGSGRAIAGSPGGRVVQKNDE